MPTAMTFNSLTADLQSYLERGGSVTDPTVFSQLPKLINLAERAIARRLKILGMNMPVATLLQQGQSVYPKPNGWRRTISMGFGTAAGSQPTVNQNYRNPIYSRSYEYCRKYWPDDSVLDTPKFYADYDYKHWLIVPTPSYSYPWEILYYGLPPLLDNTNQQNFWTNFAPETLLYRALLECTPYLKNDERIGTWTTLYEEGATNLEKEDLMRTVDRAATRKED